ncbi:TP53-binding protein 1-like isoform X2 [Mercenaria mercenaria]|uniref:TP53-binding protein 1-like isoform X2 n=1 Tax=Mercenaria mercenaria TaxID=6596 RepID=UPI00234EFDB9|nr:TP53-binding protein 1-like isoform X2 [Mercenaria mercenaria]
MDDIEEPGFSENTQGQSSFIIVPSQEETQQESQVDKQMMKILKNLPALQNPDKGVLSSDTCTDEEHEKGKVSVLVSDTDSVHKTDANVGPSDCISDSDSEEDVTVIQKKLSGERTDDDSQHETGNGKNPGSGSGSSQSNVSSFQSRSRSNLGSYDQCEVYKTQRGHLKVDKFDLFPASQDIFEETGDQQSPSTPSEHLGSLHLSQKPMLVPESVEETINEIPPSPGVYGSTPIIIPSSPTQETGNQSIQEAGDQNIENSDEGNQTVFDINAADTLTSQPQDDCLRDGSSEGSGKDKQTDTSQAIAAGLPEHPGEDGMSESVRLNLSEGTLNTENKVSHKKNPETRQQRPERGLRPLLSSQKLQVAESCGSEREVIVIPSGSGSLISQKEAEESDNFLLRLTPSETSTTQGQRSQIAAGRESHQFLDEETRKTKNSQNNSAFETKREGSQDSRSQDRGHRKEGSQNSRSQDRGHRKEGSQDSRSQDRGHRKEGSQDSRSRDRLPSSGSGSGSQNKKKSKIDKQIESMNDNPLIEWRNESDTERKQEMSVKSTNRFSDEFHLAVPGEMSASEPHVAMETEKPLSQSVDSNTQPQAAQQRGTTSDSGGLVPISLGDEEPDKLSIGMIQSESEQTEPVFKLQKPTVEDLSILDESEEVFPRRTGRQRGQSRFILEDSDEEYNINPNTGDTEKLAGTDVGSTGMDKKETEEGTDMTQSYEANLNIQTDVNGNKEQISSKKSENISSAVSVEGQGTTRMRRLTESSTQTADGKMEAFESVDINVAQKVADYLQSGIASRSRSNSTCTDLSDLPGEGSEKGDNLMKTPQRKDRPDKLKTPTALKRRESADQRSPKSPQQIQSIIKTYSDILKKKHKEKTKTDDKIGPSSQKPNPIVIEEDNKRKMVPRQLSSQSLPEELLRTKHGRQTPTGSLSGTQSGDQWMTARKPDSQLSVESESKSDKISEVNSPKRDLTNSETGVTQDLSKSFRPHSELEDVLHDSEPVVISQDNMITETEIPTEKLRKRKGSPNTNEEATVKQSPRKVEDKSKDKKSSSDNVSATEKLVLTPSKQNKASAKTTPPFLTLERVDSPKKMIDRVKVTEVSEADIPVGTENENFVRNKDHTVSTHRKQKTLSLKPKETLIITSADNEICDQNTAVKQNSQRTNSSNPSPKRATLQRADTEVLSETNPSRKPYYAKSLRSKKKVKRRLSAEKRNISRRRTASLSPTTVLSGASPPVVSSRSSQQTVSGSFVASTQKFSPKHKGEGHDVYGFHGTESQPSPEKSTKPASTPGKTPLSTRKRARLQHKKSGLKKARHETEETETSSQNKHHVTFQTSPRISSQSSDTTVTTIGSLPSIPSSISQSSPGRDTVVSPSSSSSRQSVSEEINTRLGGKRMSLDQALPDTLPLTHSEEDNYQKVTVVIEKVERVYREIITTRKVIGAQGQVLENTQDVKRLDPVIVEENTHKKVQYVYIPSPSRSVSSLTSGDLADVSSSLSRSSVSSGSLGSKVGSLSSSLENRHSGSSKHLETQTSLDKSQPDLSHTEANQTGAKTSESLEAVSEKSHSSEIMAAPSSVPRPRYQRVSSANTDSQSGSVGKLKEHSVSTEDQNLTGIQSLTPVRGNAGYQTQQTPAENQTKPETPAVQSDQEVSDVQTPLGSTINKTSSYLHSRTSSVESPKTSDSLFSTSSDENKKSTSNLGNSRTRKKSMEDSSTDNSTKQNRSSDQVSTEIPDQEQLVSSSSTPEEPGTIVTSDGKIGSKVMAKWKDGFFYPGTLKSSADRYFRHSVHFDDGSKLPVKAVDILLIERLPLGQSVMVLTDEGDFESGLITKIEDDTYIVETDEGTSRRYTSGQVILSADQAACVISDHGSDVLMQLQAPAGLPVNVGDVSLENLLDAPRRSAKKTSAAEVKVEDEGQGQSGRSRKRKLDTLKPQATSTPTPKGKAESVISKRRKMLTDSPIAGIQSSPVTGGKSLRKTRIGLFGKDLGPVPTKKIFKNIYFLLTNVEKSKEQNDQEKKLIQDTSLDTSTDESAAEEETSVPFDKEHLKRQVEAGGGTVLDNLDENLISKGKRRIILLSSTYQRTIKYLQCLACSIPCLSHMWVVDSCTQERLLDDKSYVLPAGISLEKRNVMEWRKKNNVFQGIKAVVYSKNKKFVDSWTQILSLSKCHVHKQVQYTDVHVIVTDGTCTPTIQRGAESNCIPLVGTEWVIQCLVNGRLMSYTGHAQYSHDC